MFAIETNEPAQPKVARERRQPEAPRVLAEDPTGAMLDFLRRRWGWLVLGGLAGLALGALYALSVPNRYAATSQLIIDPRDLRVLQNEVAPGAINNDSTTAYLESQARLIQSDVVRRRVIEREGLTSDPDFGGPSAGLLERVGLGRLLPGDADAAPTRDPTLSALAMMDRLVDVRRGERTFVIDITTTTGDPEKSARISNALAEAYLEDQARSRSDVTERAASALSGRIDELRARVKAAEDKVQDYRSANSLVSVGGRLVTDDQLALANAQLAQATSRTAEAAARYEQVRTLRPASLEAGAVPEALQSQNIANLRLQLGQALTRESDAQTLYGGQHPALVSARAQVTDARRQIAEELQRIVQAARAEVDRARAAERSATAEVERLKAENLSKSQAGVELRELEREAEASRAVYEAVLRRVREAGEMVGVDTTNARIITVATPPLDKVGPNRKLYAAAGLVLGLGAGFMLGFAREMMAGGGVFARSPGPRAVGADVPQRPAEAPPPAEPEPRGNAKVFPFRAAREDKPEPLRAVSGAPASATARRWRRNGDGAGAAPAGATATELGLLLVEVPQARPSPAGVQASAFHGAGLITESWDMPRGAFARAIRRIRDRLVAEAGATRGRKVLVVGLEPGLGTSTVALNLALAAAQEGATPLLIDAARGALTLTDAFAADAGLGLGEVVSGASGLVRAALQDEETGAFFLPWPQAGTGRRGTIEAAALERSLFAQTKRFDMVVIDGGALVDGAQPGELAQLADDIVVVTRPGTTPEQTRRLLARAWDERSAKLSVHGAVAQQGRS